MNNKKKNKITIEWYIVAKDFIRNSWILLMSVLIGYMGIYIVSHKIYTPEYTSSATLVVNASGAVGGSYSLYSVSSEMANVLTNIFSQPAMKDRAAESVGADGFDGEVSASVMAETNFILLNVTADNPQKAYELLTGILNVYPELSKNVFANARMTVVRTPSMPQAPSNSISDENRGLVVSSCFILAATAIFILSITRDTVKNETDFNEKIDSRLLGTIMHEDKKLTLRDKKLKKKKGLLLHSNAFISLRFAEGFHKIAARIEFLQHRDSSKVFAVTSVAENEGKSTIAANIAVSLADRGNKVVLVDLDGKKPALYKIFEEEYTENRELSDFFDGKISSKDFRLRRYKKSSLYLAINTKASENHNKWLESGVAERFIRNLKNKFDYVIVDTAPITLDASVTGTVKMVDKTLLVVRTDKVKVSVINDTIDNIKKLGGDTAGCVLNDIFPKVMPFFFSGDDMGGYYSTGYGKYRGYGKYGKYKGYGKYGKYSKYGKYGAYGSYGYYSEDNDDEIPADLLSNT